MKTCPFCAESIQDAAIKCRFCGTDLSSGASSGSPRRFTRSRTDRKLAGVCGGLAKYMGWDVVMVRVAFFIGAWLYGFAGIAYLAMWLIVPEER